jgi:hypothetical protein
LPGKKLVTPQEIKTRVRGAYVRALQNSTMYSTWGSRIDDLFRDVKLYGRDAGTDFVETNLGRIVEEAVRMAGCKRPCLELQVYGCGRAALEGMAQALRDGTDLKVDVAGPTVRLVWSEDNTGPV